MKIVAAEKLLKANDQIAAANRQRLAAAHVYAVNLVGSPGCGKTTLLEALVQQLRGRVAAGVVEGDIAGSIDAQRMERLGVPVVQINTDGACHLDASMLSAALDAVPLADVRLLVIENVGNLVCTAGFDLGEQLRVVMLSVTEGDDKITKYPAIFHRSDILLVSKIDLLPHTDFNVEWVVADMHRLAPGAKIFQVSARSGHGIATAADWLAERCASQAAQHPAEKRF